MKIGILTSSRADYGVYLPLIRKLHNDQFFEIEIIAFGTHLLKKFGCSIKQIVEDGFPISVKIDTMPTKDAAQDISLAMGETMNAFSKVWLKHSYDLVFAIGDRYEMFAAVSSALPFNVKIAHLHGGETTLGAIDNAFRHCITSMAKYHFTAAESYRKRVIEIVGNDDNVFNVGALSIDNIREMDLLSIIDFKDKYNIDLSIPTILITFHPVTVNLHSNKENLVELIASLKELNHYQLIITMPNADTMGLYIRNMLNTFIDQSPNAIGVENFGTLGYLSCMNHCRLMLGNTSSGFIEAAGFNKPVVNLGERQKGRLITSNIISIPIKKNEILKSVRKAEKYKANESDNFYGDGFAAEKIISKLKEIHIESI